MNTTKPVLINDDHGYGKTLRTRNESSYFYSWNKNVQPIIALKIPPNWCANSFSLYCLQDTQYRVYNPQVVKVNVTNKRGTLELKDIQKEEKPSGSSVIIRGVDMVKYQLGRCWEGEIAIHLMWGIRAGVHAISEVELYGEYTAPAVDDTERSDSSAVAPVIVTLVALTLMGATVGVVCGIVLWSRKARRNHDYEDPESHIYMETLHPLPASQNQGSGGSGNSRVEDSEYSCIDDDDNHSNVRMTHNPGYNPTGIVTKPRHHSLPTMKPTHRRAREYEQPIGSLPVTHCNNPLIVEPGSSEYSTIGPDSGISTSSELHQKSSGANESHETAGNNESHYEMAPFSGYAYVIDMNGSHLTTVEGLSEEGIEVVSRNSVYSYI
jgi:hypothetical protein